ncbi:MAG: hypothetical protein ACI9H6_000235 [Patiriisocius sp.]|jgi:hypothetical protein
MVQSKKATSTPRLTPEEFVLQGITNLKTLKYKGVHVVRSGFNTAFREYFGEGFCPIETTTQMRKDSKIAVFLARGGASLYLREDLKDSTLERHDDDWATRDQEGFQKKAPDKSPGASGDALSKILNN